MNKPEYAVTHRVCAAIRGLLIALKQEPHMRVHIGLAVLVLSPSIFISIPSVHVLILSVALILIIVLELVNTAIEATVDLITQSYSTQAKLAKDVAASAVLVMASATISLAIFIYAPAMYNLSIGVLFGH
jgi:diacylglycerol kinase (ATP)